jgi:hypothetical protein
MSAVSRLGVLAPRLTPPSSGRRAGRRTRCGRGLFRVTYATARLQTLDRGAPVSPWTVEKELGHGSREMLEEVYGRGGPAPV